MDSHAVTKRLTCDILHVSKTADTSPLRIHAWAYVCRKADGTLPEDSGGTTTQNGMVVDDATDRDVVDTPEAERAMADALYDFIGSGSGSADDMHVEFGVGKVVGGLFVTQEIAKALSVPDGILPTGALVVIDLPRQSSTAQAVLSGAKRQLSIVAAIHREEIDHAA